jgi:hypothetical protein
MRKNLIRFIIFIFLIAKSIQATQPLEFENKLKAEIDYGGGNTSLQTGIFYRDELNIDYNQSLEHGDWEGNINLSAERTMFTDAHSADINNLSFIWQNQLFLGDYNETITAYSLSQALKGLMYKNSLNEWDYTIFLGNNALRWKDLYENTGATNILGTRFRRRFSRKLDLETYFITAHDQNKLINDNSTLLGSRIKSRLNKDWRLQGELNIAGGLASRFETRFKRELKYEHEYIEDTFKSLSGTYASDLHRKRLTWTPPKYDFWDANVKITYEHKNNNLRSQKATTTWQNYFKASSRYFPDQENKNQILSTELTYKNNSTNNNSLSDNDKTFLQTYQNHFGDYHVSLRYQLIDYTNHLNSTTDYFLHNYGISSNLPFAQFDNLKIIGRVNCFDKANFYYTKNLSLEAAGPVLNYFPDWEQIFTINLQNHNDVITSGSSFTSLALSYNLSTQKDFGNLILDISLATFGYNDSSKSYTDLIVSAEWITKI